MTRYILLALMFIIGIVDGGNACTNFLITRSASGGCGNIITYAADSHTLYGFLYHSKAATYL